jgi:hypothetical protein
LDTDIVCLDELATKLCGKISLNIIGEGEKGRLSMEDKQFLLIITKVHKSFTEELHKVVHFFLRSFEVFDTESVDGYFDHPQFHAQF